MSFDGPGRIYCGSAPASTQQYVNLFRWPNFALCMYKKWKYRRVGRRRVPADDVFTLQFEFDRIKSERSASVQPVSPHRAGGRPSPFSSVNQCSTCEQLSDEVRKPKLFGPGCLRCGHRFLFAVSVAEEYSVLLRSCIMYMNLRPVTSPPSKKEPCIHCYRDHRGILSYVAKLLYLQDFFKKGIRKFFPGLSPLGRAFSLLQLLLLARVLLARC